MKIKAIKIKNFRSFKDQHIPIGDYNCFVGPNGAGKSTVLAALNVFFQERDGAATDVVKLMNEDFFQKNTAEPIEITVVFHELANEAQLELADYVRQGELSVTAFARFDENTRVAQVRHRGERLGVEEFAPYFQAEAQGSKAGELRKLYESLGNEFELPEAKSKKDMAEALHAYEATHHDDCVLIPSEDNFYGFNGTGKLAKYIQWVYVPAVKDVSEEGREGKNTALGKLISRAVRAKTNFSSELEDLKIQTLEAYDKLLKKNNSSLTEISKALTERLADWAHSGVTLGLEWQSNPIKAVRVDEPVAGIKTGDGNFEGSLARMGHGLQRSYLLALLQELASQDFDDSVSLALGIEEPELYQHPPQARHLSDVLRSLSEADNSQVLVTSHSPIFARGKDFEDLRFVSPGADGSSVKAINSSSLQQRLQKVRGTKQFKLREGLLLKLHQALQPHLSEMFFTRFPILVEGLEDVSYITSYLHFSDRWDEFRRLGCSLVPANGKSRLVKPLAIALELDMPVFTIFDSDGDCKPQYQIKHEDDNKALCTLLKVSRGPFPSKNLIGSHYAIWKSNMGDVIKDDLGATEFNKLKVKANREFDDEKSICKSDLWIAELMHLAFKAKKSLPTLEKLCTQILKTARSV